MPEQRQTAPFIDGLYGKLVEGGIAYFFPSAKFEFLDSEPGPSKHRIIQTSNGTTLILNWLGSRYSLTRDAPFSHAELKLLESIGAVLDSRYRMIVETSRVEQRFELFRGLAEDRYVSGYIDGTPYAEKVWQGPDRFEDAIEVLRTSSLSTLRKPAYLDWCTTFWQRPGSLPPTAGHPSRCFAVLSSADLNPDFLSAL